MNDLDLFAQLVNAINKADAISQDTRLSAQDRDAAARIRNGLTAFKSASFQFRDWQPSSTKTTGAATA